MNNLQIILLTIVAINIIAFAMFGIDKALAVKGKSRIPEKALFLIAILAGSVGAWSSMLLFRHKTQKWYFSIGMPVILLAQIALAFYLMK